MPIAGRGKHRATFVFAVFVRSHQHLAGQRKRVVARFTIKSQYLKFAQDQLELNSKEACEEW
eukprot:10536188-Alexandrium_andersonii.AAC.1